MNLRKDLIRMASVMRPSPKRTALIQMLAADDKVKVKRKDTGREVWVTKDKANDPDYEQVKGESEKKDQDAPTEKDEKPKDKGDKAEKGAKDALSDAEFKAVKTLEKSLRSLKGKDGEALLDKRDGIGMQVTGAGKTTISFDTKKVGEDMEKQVADAMFEAFGKDAVFTINRKRDGKVTMAFEARGKKTDAPKEKDEKPKKKDEKSDDKPEKKDKDAPKSDEDEAAEKARQKKELSPKDLSKLRQFKKTQEKAKAKAENAKKKDSDKTKKTDAQLMQEFEAEASAEMKERMKDMSPKEFKAMLAAITDEDEGGDKAASLRKNLIRVASQLAPGPERTQLIQALAASKTPDGGDAPDEGGDDEGSEDPNEHPGVGEADSQDDKQASIKLGSKLSKEQIEEVRGEMKNSGGVPVRFMSGGESMDIITGKKTGKGVNVMHQLVYWNFPKETSKKIAKWLGVRAEFSKAASVKTASFPYLDRRSKNLSREGISGGGLDKTVMRAGDGFALYKIDVGKNESKFYEGMVMPDESRPGTHRTVFRWGALTDNNGRADGRKYDEKFSGLTEAQAYKFLNAKKRAKTGKGYIDTMGSKHKMPSGKALKQGEYPIGLARGVPFGWGVQEMAFCVPALRQIGEQIAAALDPNDGTSAVVDLKAALRLVSGVPDSNMAGKITQYIGGVMRGIARGDDQQTVNKKLFTIKNYIDKQVALCD